MKPSPVLDMLDLLDNRLWRVQIALLVLGLLLGYSLIRLEKLAVDNYNLGLSNGLQLHTLACTSYTKGKRKEPSK